MAINAWNLEIQIACFNIYQNVRREKEMQHSKLKADLNDGKPNLFVFWPSQNDNLSPPKKGVLS